MKSHGIRAVAFDCFGTLLHIRSPKNPWKALLTAARQADQPTLDPRREPIPTIEEFAAACGVAFQEEWRRDLDVELASIDVAQGAYEVLDRLRGAGFRLALASNLAPAYVAPTVQLLGDLVDVTCFSCDPDVWAVKPTTKFFSVLRARLGLPAAEILMVGDSFASDIQGAQVAGMHAAHLVSSTQPYRPGQILRLSDVPDILGCPL